VPIVAAKSAFGPIIDIRHHTLLNALSGNAPIPDIGDASVI